MPKTAKKAAAAILSITADCDLNGKGFGAMPFVQHTNFITNQEALSAAKKHLLAAGYESLDLGLMEWLGFSESGARDEVRERWTEEDCVLGWDPRGDNAQGDSWTLVAMLSLREDGQGVHDAVALYARPAGMVDQVPRIPPEVDLGPESDDEQPPAGPVPEPAPAMTKSEAHLGRKSAQFELLEPTDALLKTFTPRVEKHGDQDDEREPDIGDGVEGDDDGPPLDSDEVVHDVVESEGVAS